VNPPVQPLSDDVWFSLCEIDAVRPSCVAAARARLAANDWPTPLELADALLDWQRWLPVAMA